MNENHRADILSLNLKDIKKSLPSALQTKLIVSKENQDNEPLPQNIIKPWMLSISSQTCVSRNKVGQELLQHCRHGFVLDDPYIRETRFYVDYHRMHDPGLKSYYTSIPVRNRVKKLELVTGENDALCTNKEFMDYIRYLDTNINHNLTQVKQLKRKRRLLEHFHMLQSVKEHESGFTGIFRKKKYTFENVSKAHLDQKRQFKLGKLVKKGMKAVERHTQLMEKKSMQFRERHQAKLEKLRPRKQIIIQNEMNKRIELLKIINGKLYLAKNRRDCMTMEKGVKKMNERIDHCRRHASFRNEILQKNIEIFKMYEEEQRKNIEERKKRINELREYNESKIIRLRGEIAKKERNADVVEKFMKNIELLKVKYMESFDPADSKEVYRRFALLKQPFITECVEIASSTLQHLNLPVSAAVLAARTRRIMELRSIIIPEIGASKCVFVQGRVAELISLTIKHIKNERLKTIKDCWNKRKLREAETEAEASDHKSKNASPKKRITVSVNESSKIIGESAYSEFIGDLAQISASGLTAFYNLNVVVKRELKEFFEFICQEKFEFSTKLDDRDFMHVYNFQKYLIYKSIRRLMEYVKIKQNHFWTRARNIHTWRLLDLNLADISLEAAALVMDFPNKIDEFCECIKKISKFICVQMSDTLEKENIEDSDSMNERYSFFSEIETVF
ncbi:uncharacterized protein LOC129567897 [Sitodiplosis mosellana]|uniref:uncharacterized protein LOC129567897 n=1 Tax=Sitodiplosis mosellana TaxID=263140 RepID=UPI00244410AA|nr:uncharacterized protein LOC129567897 [Sitodiplosis mosellana]